jgi:hypothetical protein
MALLREDRGFVLQRPIPEMKYQSTDNFAAMGCLNQVAIGNGRPV